MQKIKEGVVLIGSGGHAKVLLDNIEASAKWEIKGVVTTHADRIESFCGYPVFGPPSVLSQLYEEGLRCVALGIGGMLNVVDRSRVFRELVAQGFSFASTIHPSAVVSNRAFLARGVHLFAGAIIQASVSLGENAVVYGPSIVGHDSQIGDNVLISAGVTIGGGAEIGSDCLLAVGCTVCPRCKVASGSSITAGAVVSRDITEPGRYTGRPARKLMTEGAPPK